MLSNFTPLFELLGAIAIAFTGFKEFSAHFSNYFEKNFSDFTKKIDAISDEPFSQDTVILEFLNFSAYPYKFISKVLLLRKYNENSKFWILSLNEEIVHSKIIFKNCSLFAFLLSLEMLLIGCLEPCGFFENTTSKFSENFLFSNWHYSLITYNIIILILFIILFPIIRFNVYTGTGPFMDKVEKLATCLSKERTFYLFIILNLFSLAIILITNYFNLLYFPVWKFTVIFFAALFSLSSILSLFYRYYFYLNYKIIVIKRIIRKIERLREELKILASPKATNGNGIT